MHPFGDSHSRRVWTAAIRIYPSLRDAGSDGHDGRALCRLSDRAGLSNLAARLGTAPARFGRFSHRFHVGVFSAFGRASITDVCAKGAELVRKLGIRRQQPCGQTTYWCAFAAKANGSCHGRRVICERCIDAGRAPVQALQAVFNGTLYDRVWDSRGGHRLLLLNLWCDKV